MDDYGGYDYGAHFAGGLFWARDDDTGTPGGVAGGVRPERHERAKVCGVGGNQVFDLGELGAKASQGDGPNSVAEGQAEEEDPRALAGSGSREKWAG
jgi:hypothetical protein